jgi:SSS family transporter
MHYADWIVLAIYIVVMVGIGVWANRRQTDTEAYFVGNRNIHWWAAGLSIIATSFSAASILGVPGYAYTTDMWYLQYQLGDFLGAGIVAVLFIPFFHKIRGLTTAYEYLEVRFDGKTRLLGSTLFSLTVLLRAGTLLFGAALLFSAVAPTQFIPGLDGVEEAVVLFGIIAIIYTVMGGISAVIWTDVIQFAIMSLGIIAAMTVVVLGTPGGWGTAFSEAAQLDKLDIVHLEEPFGGTGLVTAIFGYGLLALSLFGTNQQPVQRYMTVKNPREAQQALVLGVGAGAIGVTLSLLLGVFLFIFYNHFPALLPADLTSDQIMPHFVNTQVPPIITGLLVAAVFAAAMSSLDSALNSLSAALTVDFLDRFKPGVSMAGRLTFAKFVVVTAGVLGIAIGIYAARTQEPLINLILTFMGYFAGGLLGLFLLGMLTKRANGHGAFTGAIVGTLVVLMVTENDFRLPRLYDTFGFEPIPFIWSTAVGLVVTVVVGYAISLFGRPIPPERLEHTTVNWNKRNVAGTAAIGLMMGACAPVATSVAPPMPMPGAPQTGAEPALPPVPARTGALDISISYPGEGATIGVRDSTFIFGHVGTGAATLDINGAPVEVAPNGAFLAFLPVPADGEYLLRATANGEMVTATHTVELPPLPPLPGTGSDTVAPPTTTPVTLVGVVASSRPDGTAIGTAVPGSGTPYHWFFPNGAVLGVTGARAGQYRVALTEVQSVWVDTAEVDVGPEGAALPDGFVSTIQTEPEPGYIDFRLSTPYRMPFRVDPRENGVTVTVYGAETRTNWMHYGPMDPLIDRLGWEAVADDVFRFEVDLTQPLWGYTSFYDADGYPVVRVRRPPPIDPSAPFNGLYIAIDAGHPPGGAIGPSGFTEAEANLAISKYLISMLTDRGARVLEIRPDTAAVGLGARPMMATDSSAHLLVSVHNNAFPDGVNPWENNGTSVFYNQEQSLDLARHLQLELLSEFRLRDLGIARADLALVRPTWMPSALTETMFLMIPRQEAALMDPAVQERVADAHLRGLESFLRGRAAAASDATWQ